MELIVFIVLGLVVVALIITAHFTQRTAQEMRRTREVLEKTNQNLESLMRGAEVYMNHMLAKK